MNCTVQTCIQVIMLLLIQVIVMYLSCYIISLHTDVNECEGDILPCADNAECYDTKGSFECICLSGYSGDGDLSCTGLLNFDYLIMDIFISMLPFHIDIDECMISDDFCAMNATCTNSEGSYNCSCDTGFYGNGTTCCE